MNAPKTTLMIKIAILLALFWAWLIYEFRNAPHVDSNDESY
jgi:hypothetical protein